MRCACCTHAPSFIPTLQHPTLLKAAEGSHDLEGSAVLKAACAEAPCQPTSLAQLPALVMARMPPPHS